MITTDISIINKLGLHARAAAKFVSLASTFESTVAVAKEGRVVDGKSIMSVMMLAASKGSILKLAINGVDEVQALAALQTLINNRFDESE